MKIGLLLSIILPSKLSTSLMQLYTHPSHLYTQTSHLYTHLSLMYIDPNNLYNNSSHLYTHPRYLYTHTLLQCLENSIVGNHNYFLQVKNVNIDYGDRSHSTIHPSQQLNMNMNFKKNTRKYFSKNKKVVVNLYTGSFSKTRWNLQKKSQIWTYHNSFVFETILEEEVTGAISIP